MNRRYQGPWSGADDLELPSLKWVRWLNETRVHSALGHMPSIEFEAADYPHAAAPTPRRHDLVTPTGAASLVCRMFAAAFVPMRRHRCCNPACRQSAAHPAPSRSRPVHRDHGFGPSRRSSTIYNFTDCETATPGFRRIIVRRRRCLRRDPGLGCVYVMRSHASG